MEWLNYHHLQYFWMVAREGSIAGAAEKLAVSQPTISTQIKSLEASLGYELFQKSGRNLVLTDVGRKVYEYADDIFSLGQEMLGALKQQQIDKPLKLSVGIVDSLPKLIAYRIFSPVFIEGMRMPQLLFKEGDEEALIMELAAHRLDVVICNEPSPIQMQVKTFSHLLGESGIMFYAAPKLARKLLKDFPSSLDGAPILLPTVNSPLRRQLNNWFHKAKIQPQLVAEFDDLALMKTFAKEGHGFTAVHSVIQEEISERYGLKAIGEAKGLQDQVYAITGERKLKHPLVLMVTEQAQQQLFK